MVFEVQHIFMVGNRQTKAKKVQAQCLDICQVHYAIKIEATIYGRESIDWRPIEMESDCEWIMEKGRLCLLERSAWINMHQCFLVEEERSRSTKKKRVNYKILINKFLFLIFKIRNVSFHDYWLDHVAWIQLQRTKGTKEMENKKIRGGGFLGSKGDEDANNEDIISNFKWIL